MPSRRHVAKVMGLLSQQAPRVAVGVHNWSRRRGQLPWMQISARPWEAERRPPLLPGAEAMTTPGARLPLLARKRPQGM